MTPKKGLSLWDGPRAFFGGCGFIIATPRVWGYAMVPVVFALLVISALSALGIWGSVALAEHLVDEGALWGAGRVTLEIVFILMALLVSLLVGFSLAQPLSGFALEAIVRRQERALGAERAWPEQPLFPSFFRSLRVTLTSLLFGVPLLLLLTLIELLAPPAAIVTIPLKFVISALMVAWDFLDYPLGVRGAGVRQRVAFVADNFGAVLGFGALAALVLLVPGFGLLLLPMGAAGATRMVLEAEIKGSSGASAALGPSGHRAPPALHKR